MRFSEPYDPLPLVNSFGGVWIFLSLVMYFTTIPESYIKCNYDFLDLLPRKLFLLQAFTEIIGLYVLNSRPKDTKVIFCLSKFVTILMGLYLNSAMDNSACLRNIRGSVMVIHYVFVNIGGLICYLIGFYGSS